VQEPHLPHRSQPCRLLGVSSPSKASRQRKKISLIFRSGGGQFINVEFAERDSLLIEDI